MTDVLSREPTMSEREALVARLRERSRIRRQIPTRKSVQNGEPDRIADLLDEAAAALAAPQQEPVVPRQRLVDLKDWNERYPAGRVYDYSAAVKMERELQAAITPIIAILAAAKEQK